MALGIYTNSEEKSSHKIENIVTVARAIDGKKLNKTIFGDGRPDIPYGHAYKFKFFSEQCDDLQDLYYLVKLLLHRPYSCLIRGIAKDDSIIGQRRAFHNDKTKGPATIIEQIQNWFAIDVDGYDNSSGNLIDDARRVLLALGLVDVEAFVIPSANYLIKTGMRLRMFFWNDQRISTLSLKKYFTRFANVVDTALFHPIQPIYIARPNFIAMTDPCKDIIAWLPGRQIHTQILDVVSVNRDGSERKYTKKQAEGFLRYPRPVPKNIDPRILWEYRETERHPALHKVAILMGKLIGQELLDEDNVVEELMDKCAYYWRGNAKNDERTIRDGIKTGKLAMEDSDDVR